MEKQTVRIVSSAVSDKGLSDKRPVNEDSYLEMPERGLFAVADGVGGAQAGDFASQTAIEILQEAFAHPQPSLDTEELLEMAVQRANESIFQMSHELPQFEMMATTIVAVQIEGNVATIAHVGDSRLYRLDANGNLFRETRDHSMVEDEVKAGRMTTAQAANHPSRNVISRALGSEAVVDVEMRTIMFEPGATFLLCSDGVTHHLEDHEIRDVLRRAVSPADACQEIKAICYSRGAEDNLTAVIIRAEESKIPITDEDETTITGVRPVFAPDPLPALSGGGSSSSNAVAVATAVQQPRGADSTEARTNEFTALNVVRPDDATAPLGPLPAASPETPTVLKPASQTLGVTDAPVDLAASQPTLEPKIENERIRSKINAAEPFQDYSEAEKSNGLEKIFSSLILLFVGALIGAGGYYAWMLLSPPPTAAPSVQPANTIAPLNSTNDFSPQEINEFNTFERLRRTVDREPIRARTQFQQPQSAVEYYLRGRAFLLLGETANARKDLISAADELTRGNDGGVNPETLRAEIAFAQAAVGSLSQTKEDRKMLEDLVKSKQSGEPQQPAQSNR